MRRSVSTPHVDFASLLDARARAAGASMEAGVADLRHNSTIHAIEAILESAPEAQATPSIGTADALAHIFMEEPPPSAPRSMPACDPEAVAHELQLSPPLTARQLERIRRDFALANHPDRVAPGHRDLATRRMTLANVLIDQALLRRRQRASR